MSNLFNPETLEKLKQLSEEHAALVHAYLLILLAQEQGKMSEVVAALDKITEA